jgi:PKD repeat protein
MSRNLCLSTLLVLVIVATTSHAQLSQSLPNGLLAAEGSSSSAFPWATTAANCWHFNYDTSNFVANYPIIITGLSMRANGGANAAGGTHPNVEVTMCSSLVDWSATGNTTVFASVMDVDAALVYTGPFTMAAGVQTTPAAWQPIGPITPFFYDPTLGKDFIIQVRTHGPNQNMMGTVDLHSGGSAQRYGSQTSSTVTQANFSNVNIVAVVKIDYVPASGLYANFTATGASGPAPRTVNFTDTSISTAPGGVTSWNWDFENDGITDSTLQNPSHTYLVPGDYTVALTVNDGQFPTSAITKTNFVHVAQYVFDAATTGGGVGDLSLTGIPSYGGPAATHGFTLVSFLPAPSVGTGPLCGITPDAFTWQILAMPEGVGNPLHYTLTPGIYPETPFLVPAGVLSSFVGVTADFVQVGLTPSYTLVFVSNCDRITF